MDTRRIKTLTPKGNELYRINFSKYYSQTEKIWNDIRQNLQVDIESINNLSVLESKDFLKNGNITLQLHLNSKNSYFKQAQKTL